MTLEDVKKIIGKYENASEAAVIEAGLKDIRHCITVIEKDIDDLMEAYDNAYIKADKRKIENVLDDEQDKVYMLQCTMSRLHTAKQEIFDRVHGVDEIKKAVYRNCNDTFVMYA